MFGTLSARSVDSWNARRFSHLSNASADIKVRNAFRTDLQALTGIADFFCDSTCVTDTVHVDSDDIIMLMKCNLVFRGIPSPCLPSDAWQRLPGVVPPAGLAGGP